MNRYCRNCDSKLPTTSVDRNELCKACKVQYAHRKKAEQYKAETGRELFGPEPTWNPLGPIWPKDWQIEDYNRLTHLSIWFTYIGQVSYE